MNIKPEQIPNEVVEAAIEAIRAEELRALGGYKTPDNGARRNAIRHALAAALPVLLEQKGWWCQTSHGVVVSKTKLHGGCEPLFRFTTLPTQDTPNE